MRASSGLPARAVATGLPTSYGPSGSAAGGGSIIRRAIVVFAAPVVGLLAVATSASGGFASQTVGSLLPGGGSTTQSNISVSSLSPSVLIQPNLDEAYSASALNGPSGLATLNVHACSGPNSFGSADGNGSLGYTNSYAITSTTLATGTQVFLTLVADGARRATANLTDSGAGGSVYDTAGVNGAATIRFAFSQSNASYSFAGTFNDSQDPFDPPTMTKTGLFNGQDSQQVKTFVGGTLMGGVIAATIGDTINVSVSADIFSASGAASAGVIADVDGQMALNWGVSALDSRVQLVSAVGEQAPNNSGLTLPDVIANLPPRPPTIPGLVPEPSSLALCGIAGLAGLVVARVRRIRAAG